MDGRTVCGMGTGGGGDLRLRPENADLVTLVTSPLPPLHSHSPNAE